ncbi:DUF3221 domain-containing protein [Cohnella suwonensis]|uniref:DUF3221 domain-containing protein n=1 Tax=Cohnella suwonensis TaxID=696072 RepID=A0ABW0LSL1_9BACL
MKFAKIMFVAVFALTLVATLAACGNKPEKEGKQAGGTPEVEAGYIGYVVKAEGGRILVVSPVERNFGSGGAQHYYEAIWFAKVPDDIEIGQRVEVIPEGGIEESYPAQGIAASVMVLPATNAPQGAKLTEAEAIRRALGDERAGEYEIPAVKKVGYDAESKKWVVALTQSGDEKSIEIDVADSGSTKSATNEGYEPFGDKPPLPKVAAGETTIAVLQSSYCWSGKSSSVCADYAGPQDMLKDKPKDAVKPGARIAFAFATKPPTASETHVSLFNEDGAVVEVKLDGNAFVAPSEPGIYYYGLSVWWMKDVEKRISENSSSYAFAIEVKE